MGDGSIIDPKLSAALGTIVLLILSAGAEAAVWVTRRGTPYAVSGTSAKEIGRQISQHEHPIAVTTSIRRRVKFAVIKPSSCYVASAQFGLLMVASHPQLEGKLSPSLRMRWITLDAAVKAGRNKDWQWAVQAVHGRDAATANLSMKEDPKCYKFKSFITDRLDFLDRQHRERSRQFEEALYGPNGAVGKAAAAFYGER